MIYRGVQQGGSLPGGVRPHDTQEKEGGDDSEETVGTRAGAGSNAAADDDDDDAADDDDDDAAAADDDAVMSSLSLALVLVGSVSLRPNNLLTTPHNNLVLSLCNAPT